MGRSPWNDAPLTDRDHDAAGPIGRKRVEEEITLTRIQKNSDGVYEYGPEIPALERFDEPQESFDLGYAPGKRTPARHAWTRLVVRAKKADGHIQEGDHLVVTRFPYSTGWACILPFKRPTKDADRVSLPQAFSSAVDFVRALEDLPNDYFERGDYWTAGMSYPCVPFLDEATNRQADAERVYGICRDPKAVEADLLSSSKVLKLFDQTETGTIKFGFEDSHPLYDELKKDAQFFMLCSIRQALAGPANDSLTAPKTRTVLKQVEFNYRDHLNRANKAYHEVKKKKDRLMDAANQEFDRIKNMGDRYRERDNFDEWLHDIYLRHVKK